MWRTMDVQYSTVATSVLQAVDGIWETHVDYVCGGGSWLWGHTYCSRRAARSRGDGQRCWDRSSSPPQTCHWPVMEQSFKVSFKKLQHSSQRLRVPPKNTCSRDDGTSSDQAEQHKGGGSNDKQSLQRQNGTKGGGWCERGDRLTLNHHTLVTSKQ